MPDVYSNTRINIVASLSLQVNFIAYHPSINVPGELIAKGDAYLNVDCIAASQSSDVTSDIAHNHDRTCTVRTAIL